MGISLDDKVQDLANEYDSGRSSERKTSRKELMSRSLHSIWMESILRISRVVVRKIYENCIVIFEEQQARDRSGNDFLILVRSCYCYSLGGIYGPPKRPVRARDE